MIKLDLSNIHITELNQNIEDIADILTDLEELELDTELVKSLLDCAKELRRINLNQISNLKLNLCIIGKTSSGKSTLINSLLKENLLPTSVVDTSRYCVRFMYRPFEYIENADTKTEISKVEFSKIVDYNVMKDKASNPILINYYHPAEILHQINIIDTPGIGSCYGHDKIIAEHVKESDIVFFLRDSALGGNLTEDESGFINIDCKKKVGSLWYMVFTKASANGDMVNLVSQAKQINANELNNLFDDFLAYDSIEFLNDDQWTRLKSDIRNLIKKDPTNDVDICLKVRYGEIYMNDVVYSSLISFFEYQQSWKAVKRVIEDAARKHFQNQDLAVCKQDQLYRKQRHEVYNQLFESIRKVQTQIKQELPKNDINKERDKDLKMVFEDFSVFEKEFCLMLDKSIAIVPASSKIFNKRVNLVFSKEIYDTEIKNSNKLITQFLHLNPDSIKLVIKQLKQTGIQLSNKLPIPTGYMNQDVAKRFKNTLLIKSIVEDFKSFYFKLVSGEMLGNENHDDLSELIFHKLYKIPILLRKVLDKKNKVNNITLSARSDMSKIEIKVGSDVYRPSYDSNFFSYMIRSANGYERVTFYKDDKRMRLSLKIHDSIEKNTGSIDIYI